MFRRIAKVQKNTLFLLLDMLFVCLIEKPPTDENSLSVMIIIVNAGCGCVHRQKQA